MRIYYLVLFTLLFTATDCGNILALFPFPLFSHTNALMPLLKELSVRGHNITMVSPYKQKEPLENWTDLTLNKTRYAENFATAIHLFFEAKKYRFYPVYYKFCNDLMSIAYEDDTLQSLIKAEHNYFDVIVTEPLFCHESLVGFGHKLNIPVIGTYPLPLTAWPRYIMNNEFPLSYVPNCQTPYTDKMSLLEKIDNAIVNAIQILYGLYYYLPEQEGLMNKHLVYKGSENRPRLIEMLRNVSINLIDAHNSVGYPEPIQPHIIPVGGMSLKSSDKLPQDLQEYMDKSENGVILLSLGSHISVSSLDDRIIDAMFNTFRKLDVNVLMKWESSTIPNKPHNVEIRKWLPQPDILAHPKCRMFITHGGVHGVTEALYNGVPIVGIPFFSDQEYNLRFSEVNGFGIILKKEEITLETFQNAIDKVLNDKSFTEKAIRRSQIIKDRPQLPVETAVYWVEYVLRHKDVSHLKPASVHMPLYEVYLIEIISILILAVLVPLIIGLCVTKIFTRMVLGSKSGKK